MPSPDHLQLLYAALLSIVLFLLLVDLLGIAGDPRYVAYPPFLKTSVNICDVAGLTWVCLGSDSPVERS